VAQNKALREANEQLSGRRKRKKVQIAIGGSLTIEEGLNIIQERQIEQQLGVEAGVAPGATNTTTTTQRKCGLCKAVGHNSRTCQKHQN
jgi:hypothetical protein